MIIIYSYRVSTNNDRVKLDIFLGVKSMVKN